MNLRPPRPVLLLLGLVNVLPPAARAVETQVKSYRTVADFAPGEMDHVSVSPQGRLVLSPGYRRLAEMDEPVAWSAAVDAQGDVLVGTGHDGKVLHVAAAGGKPTVLLDASELEVCTVAAGKDGTVYAGTSPDGKVYRVAKTGGAPEVFFDPEERYIWALLPGADGSLYVATGDKGAVYRVTPAGVATAVLTVEETHVLSLAIAPDGTLYAGSGGNGYVYRMTPDGKTTVLLDTAGSEVKALALDGDGNLFAASTGRPVGGPEMAPVVPVAGATVTARPFDDLQPGMEEAQAPAPSPPAPAQQPQATPAPIATAAYPSIIPGGFSAQGPRQSWLYRIRKDGLPEEIWRSDNETVHAMALLAGEVILGTGDEGKVFAVDPATGRASILLDFPGAQVTALARRGDGLAVVTANLASVWAVDAGPAPEGTYTSPVIDAGHFATWGRLTVTATGTARAETRSGNTEKPGTRWSPWEDATGEVKSPKGRYLQYRLKLSAPGGKEKPEVKEVELAYLPFNLAPRIKSIAVLAPHMELISNAPSGAAAASGSPLPPLRARARTASAMPGGEIKPSPREQETHGIRSVRFEVDDPNDDDMQFRAYYKGEEESDWKPLGKELTEPFLSFDSTSLPDGTYTVKVVASDNPSNPEGRALRSELVSEPFVIDNTPPRVEVTATRGADGKLQVKAELSDRGSVIEWAEYALDGGPWRPMDPEDLVFDEHEETAVIELSKVGEGEHTVIVRAEDAARNVGSGKAVVHESVPRETRTKVEQGEP